MMMMTTMIKPMRWMERLSMRGSSIALSTPRRNHSHHRGLILLSSPSSSSPSPSSSSSSSSSSRGRRSSLSAQETGTPTETEDMSMTMSISTRVVQTDAPCIVAMQKMLREVDREVLSLAQGIVHWGPPAESLRSLGEELARHDSSAYGPDDGLPELVDAISNKLARKNGLPSEETAVMVTAGANQAFMNIVLTLLDPGNRAVLFLPYYFNHLMALQLANAQVVYGPRDASTNYTPDLDWLESQMQEPTTRPRLVVIVNPCNPTGVVIGKDDLEQASALCEKYGVWLCIDNTYEYFIYDPENKPHHTVSGKHVVNVFSFSKVYGMMGWRVGYIAYAKSSGLGPELLKVQDTIPICPSTISQKLAVSAIAEGEGWIQSKVTSLHENKAAVIDALAPLGSDNVYGGDGSIYLFCKLPQLSAITARTQDKLRALMDKDGLAEDEYDKAVIEWLAMEHGVAIIPGSSCGAPGYARVAYANLPYERCLDAAQRLKNGLTELCSSATA